jgi:hypothetical protein
MISEPPSKLREIDNSIGQKVAPLIVRFYSAMLGRPPVVGRQAMLEDERWCTAWFLRDVQEGEFQCEIS